MRKYIFYLFVSLSGIIHLAAQDVFLDIISYNDGVLEITMSNTEPVRGFQFNLVSPENDFTVTDVFGGRADESGFLLLFNDSGMILSYSPAGENIPPGDGTLCFVEAGTFLEGMGVSIENAVFSGPGGISLNVQVGDPFIVGGGTQGCMDPVACNYDPDVTVDDGTCSYPDCAGNCFGSSYEDDCGVCDDDPANDNESCTGCLDPDAANYCEDCLFDCNGCCIPSIGWSVDPGIYEYSGTIAAVVYFNGIPVGSETDMVGVFVGEEIRGFESGLFFPPLGQYEFLIMVYSNQVSGEELNFKYWDSATNTIYNLEETIIFEADMLIGDPMNPIELNYHSSIPGCTDPTAVNYQPEATLDDGSCIYEFECPAFEMTIAATGISQLIVLSENTIGLEPGDVVGVYDLAGRTSNGDCSDETGELLVGSGVWTGAQLEISAIGAVDNCAYGGFQLPGYIDGNSVIIRIWRPSENLVYETGVTFEMGEGVFGEIFSVISQVDLLDYYSMGCTDPGACNYDPAAGWNNDCCEMPDCAGICGGDAFIDDCGICYWSGMDNPVPNLCFGEMIDGQCMGEWSGFDFDLCGQCFGSEFADSDNDGLGDSCDPCPNDPDNDPDEDGICDDVDNCPLIYNPDQEDYNENGIGDVCEEYPDGDATVEFGALDLSNPDYGSLEILYNSTEDIYGFQFSITDLPLTEAGSPLADFTVEVNPESEMVVGYSFTGAFYPAGSGTLCTLYFELTSLGSVCINDMIFAGEPGGISIPVTLPDCLDLTGYVFDCTGTLNGDAFIDDCGVCSGGSSGHEPNSDMDACGVCFGETSEALPDCSGEICGTAWINECGICVEGNTGLLPDEGKDCTGECGGEAFIDDCGVCSGGNTGHEPNSEMDCGGICFGIAYLDEEGYCVIPELDDDDLTDYVEMYNLDCNNVVDGQAFIDACGVCSGGNTGHEPDSDMDECGVCFGDGTSCLQICDEQGMNTDCAGNCFSEAQLSWIGDGYCDDGTFGVDLLCSDWDFDNGDCAATLLTSLSIGFTGTDGWFDFSEALFSGVQGQDLSVRYGPPFVLGDGGTVPVITHPEPQYWDIYIAITQVSADLMEISVINRTDIAGFQFIVVSSFDDFILFAPQGGAAQDQGMMVSTGADGIVLAFSLTGMTIPGSDTCPDPGMITDCAGNCFGTDVLADLGNGICDHGLDGPDFSCEKWDNDSGDCVEPGIPDLDGCTDPDAVNYDPEATQDDGSCFYYQAVMTLPLHSGANLVSFYALPDNAGVFSVMGAIAGNSMGILGEGIATQYLSTTGEWVGSLTQFNFTQGYWVIMDAPDTLDFGGWSPETDLVFTLHAGANLISYPFPGSASLASTLPTTVLESLSGIFGEGVVAIPHPAQPGEWIGSLTELSGGRGYWFLSNEDVQFSYIPPPLTRVVVEEQVTQPPDELSYAQSTQQAFYFVEDITLYGIEPMSTDWVVALCNGKTAGARLWSGRYTDIPVMGSDGRPVTDNYCQPGDLPEFFLVRTGTGEWIPLTGDINAWQNNNISVLGKLHATADLPHAFQLLPAYPNPFNARITLEYQLFEPGEVKIRIYDVQGQQVDELFKSDQPAGAYTVQWDASGLASGIYLVRLTVGRESVNQKIILLK